MEVAYHYTISTTKEGIEAIVADVENDINSKIKKYMPFRVVIEKEPMEGVKGGEIVRFRLVVRCAPYVDDKQALRFTREIDRALTMIDELNEQNYVVVRPPKGGPR